MFFKDVVTEIIEILLKPFSRLFKKNNPMLCQVCGKALIKKENPYVHYAKVASTKFAIGAISAIVGETTSCIPAPDYEFACPKCGAKYVRADLDVGKQFILVSKGNKGD